MERSDGSRVEVVAVHRRAPPGEASAPTPGVCPSGPGSLHGDGVITAAGLMVGSNRGASQTMATEETIDRHAEPRIFELGTGGSR
jgi:hypothetical protein